MSDHNIGVYVCSGCDIGNAVNLEKLQELVEEDLDFDFSLFKIHNHLCGKNGCDLIKEDIEKENIDAIVIGACSPRVNHDVFNFGDNVIVERANLREHIAWTQPHGEEDTILSVSDSLRMSIAKISDIKLLTPYKPQDRDFSKSILIVGGGLSGMTASIEISKAGYKTVLVEKEDNLGGFLKDMKSIITSPYKEISESPLEEMVNEVSSDKNITVYTGAKVSKIEGAPGLFDVEIDTKDKKEIVSAGAIIQATGWVPYDAGKLGHLGYGKFKNVVTNADMERMAKNNEIKRPSDGEKANTVLFIQCAGSRDKEHLPYCSSVCCLVSLKQAEYVKQKNPEAVNYILYKDIRTLGQAEDFYRKSQSEGNIFIKGSVLEVGESGDKLFVNAKDELLGEDITIEDIDLIVLAAGMVSASKPEIVPKIKAPENSTDADEDGMMEVLPDSGVFATQALNLAYRQGPELPTLHDGFPDSHFICFPYETRRTGIYAAGCVRRPMESAKAKDDACGAAMKSIQAVEAVSLGKALHPRSGDMSYPEINLQRCTQCKRCTEECPFGALNEDDKANPLANPTRCRRCSVCMGACPERVVSFLNYSVPIIGNMIKAINVPEEDEEKPRVIVFVCENDAYPALDMAGIKRMQWSPFVRFIPIRCLGSLNLVWINDALSRGIDGIIMMGCRHGDDYQCHFIKGSELANTRLSKVSETLERMALESDRVKFVEIGITDYHKIPDIISEFMETMEEVGPNPFKGF